MVDFSAFDSKVNMEELQKDINSQPKREYEDVPAGTYDVSFDKMELKMTKKGDKVMFAVQANILDGDQKKRKIFFNRVISGLVSPKWTDGQAIKSVMTWLDKLETGVDTNFKTYSDFAEVILDVYQTVSSEKIGATVEYDGDAFDSMKIIEVFEY